MKVLILSLSPMRKDNTVGNTYANMFDNMNDVQFHSIYCKNEKANQKFVTGCFHFTEKDILKNMLNKNHPVGKEIDIETENTSVTKHNKAYNNLRKLRFGIFFIARDLIWKTGRWKSKQLNEFLEKTSPDLIFAPLDDNIPLNKIIQYVQRKTGKKLALYAWDDKYTLNCHSFSPIFWMRRLGARGVIRKTVKQCDKLYVISQQQKTVYEECFKQNCDVLYKGYKFDEKPLNTAPDTPIKILFTGNLAYGRHTVLAAMARALHKINQSGVKAQLYIYSQTPLKKADIDKLNVENSSFFMGGVSHSEIMQLQKDADILLHVESFQKKTRNQVWLSFSTKLVDYFYQAKCIFAIGPEDVASIDYLIKNDAAITATSEKEIEEKLKMIIENPAIMTEYGNKAWECGRKNHQIDKIQSKLRKDFEELIS